MKNVKLTGSEAQVLATIVKDWADAMVDYDPGNGHTEDLETCFYDRALMGMDIGVNPTRADIDFVLEGMDFTEASPEMLLFGKMLGLV